MTSTRRAIALNALREQGHEVPSSVASWEARTDRGVQVFVAQSVEDVEPGTPYSTWVVTLTADTGVIAIERFVSLACAERPQRSK